MGGDGWLITVNSDGAYRIEESPALWGFVPYAINDFGEMAGQHGNNAAVAWIEDGVVQIQDLPLPSLNNTYSRGAGINNLGEVVGVWANSKPFLWRPAEGIIWLTPDATNPGAALDINDHGQVVGWSYDSSGRRYAFLWEDGRLSDLNVLSGVGTKSFRLGSADAINNAGQIIGHSATYKGPYVYDYGTYLLTPNP
jgi:probable HAF family extracellular repeat protein